ncbi:MAG: regulatory protein RecX [Salinimicrobium sp.]
MNANSRGKSYTVKEATLKLMQFCAYRDRSQKEVEDKLIEMRMIPEAREQIIIKLMQEGFLNEERFARSFVRGKFRIKKWGRIRIKQELKLKDISAPIIRLAMEEIDEETYFSTLCELAEKKLNLLKEPDKYKLRKKLSDHLLRKGYEANLVFEVTSDLINSEE